MCFSAGLLARAWRNIDGGGTGRRAVVDVVYVLFFIFSILSIQFIFHVEKMAGASKHILLACILLSLLMTDEVQQDVFTAAKNRSGMRIC